MTLTLQDLLVYLHSMDHIHEATPVAPKEMPVFLQARQHLAEAIRAAQQARATNAESEAK